MNKLQKLFDSGIRFEIGFWPSTEGIVFNFKVGTNNWKDSHFQNLEEGIEWLWKQVKYHYPDADCFKEEK